MIVNLSLRSPDGDARHFEFRRSSIHVGAGSRNDLVVQSSHEVVRLLRIDVSGSGFRVVALSNEERIAVVLPDSDEARTPEDELILPAGTRVLLGEDGTEIVLEQLRRDTRVTTRVVGPLGQTSVEDVVGGVNEAVAKELLLFAYNTAGADDPSEFAREVGELLARDVASVDTAHLVLPGGEESPWDRVLTFGPTPKRFPLESIGLGGAEVLEDLCQSRAVAVERGDSTSLLVPAANSSRLYAIMSLTLTTDADTAFDEIKARLRAVRPLVISFAHRASALAAAAVLREENRYFRDRQRRHYLYKELVTESPAMKRVHRNLGQLVSSEQPVLLAGEAGTGKELLARALHHLGSRASGIMISQHCGALDEDALDFELFGYARDGDGGGKASRRGIFELATGGTVFLDEVHALSPRLQLKLHRMLMEGEVFRIGESMARRVDVRVVASTHRDLMRLADEGAFRRDLAMLLTKQVLQVPPLRDRREDIRPLIETFVKAYGKRYRKAVATVSGETMDWLVKLRWPGNVRELQSVIERAVLQAGPDQDSLVREDFHLR